MEYVFAYIESPTLDKSLSYLSGVGEDLSFDIAYFLRESKCSTRYYDFNLFLGSLVYLRTHTKVDFGEKLPDTLGYKSHILYADKYKKRGIGFIDLLDYISRERNTGINIADDGVFFDTFRAFRILSKPVCFEMKRVNGIYFEQFRLLDRTSYDMTEYRQIEAKENEVGGIDPGKRLISAQSPKNGGSPYVFEDMVSGKELESLTTQRDVTARPSAERNIDTERYVMAHTHTKEFEQFEALSVATGTVLIQMQRDVKATVNEPDVVIQTEVINLGTNTKTLTYDDGMTIDVNDGTLTIVGGELISIPQKKAYTNDIGETVHNDNSGISFSEGELVGIPRKGTNSEDSLVVDKHNNEINGVGEDLLVNIKDKQLPYVHNLILVNQKTKGIYSGPYTGFVGNESKALDMENGVIDIGTASKSLQTNSEDGYFISQESKSLYQASDDDVIVAKDSPQIQSSDQQEYVGKSNKEVFSSEQMQLVNKDAKGTFYNENGFLDKASKGQVLFESEFIYKLTNKEIFSLAELAVAKEYQGMYKSDSIVTTDKKASGVNDENLIQIPVDKDGRGIVMSEYFSLYRNNTKGVYNQETTIGYKRHKVIYVEDKVLNITRNASRGIVYNETYEYITKSSYRINGYDLYEMVIKDPYAIRISNQAVLYSKYAKDTHVNREYTLFGKNPYETELSSRHYGGVSKGFRITHMESNSKFVNKNYRSTDLAYYAELVTKNYRDTNATQTSVWYKLPMVDYRVNNDVLMMYKNYTKTNTDNNIVKLKPSNRDTNKFKENIRFDFIRDFYIEKNNFIERKNDNKLLIHDKTQGQVDSRRNRDVSLERYSGFAYTDKTDYAQIKDDRVDELQLPYSDFNYENLAKRLMVDGQINPQYIKRVDDDGNIFINLPVENPIRHFADLAVQYIDLNVGMLIYIIEKIYNIWQNNIFQYSAMASDAALNDILKKTHQNLFIQYPSEKDQEHLHRAIRLFRWYAEMSILNNAEYVVKLRYKDLAIDYGNKDMSAFDGIAVFENLAIDNTFVLTPVDKSLPSQITLNLDRTHKVKPSFTAAVTGGECIIIVNDKTNTYSEEMVEFSELLEVGQNSITIQFVPQSPSAYFGVMKLQVEDYAIDSYTVSYVGKIGESNPTINHLITMLSVCGDSIDAVQKTVGHATPVANALDQMREYFNLHHEDKLKGKRLITRK